MIERIGIVSALALPAAPSQLCAAEFERVLRDMLSATIVPAMSGPADPAPAGFDRLIYVAINYWQLSRMIQRTSRLRRRSGTCEAYVFDSFHRYLQRWTARFPSPLRNAAGLLRHELRSLGAMTRIFVPTPRLVEEQSAFFDVEHVYMPIGVDAVRFGSERPDRTIDVNAYGRQSRVLTNYLSDTMNLRDGRYRFNHTDHLASITISDPDRYRAMFWRMLADSKIALAYDPEATGDGDRFDSPFVAQRWYEAIAAGCAVMGRRPPGPETARLFDWPEALIELPEDLEGARTEMVALIDDTDRLAAITRRNHRAALARHDWRHRIDAMADVSGIDRDERFTAELARVMPTEDGKAW